MSVEKLMKRAADFCGTEYPGYEWLVEGVLPHPSLGELYARRGTGKTWAALSLAVEVAHEGPWLTPQLMANGMGVLFVDGEMPPELLQDRLKGLIGEREVAERLWIAPLAAASPKPNFANKGEWNSLGELCREEGIGFVVMDNWACLVRGVDENDNKRTAEVMEGPIELRAAGVSVLWVHHAGKAGTQRGASSREDALDYVLALEGEGKPYDPARFRVEVEKSRRAVKWDAPSVELREVPGGRLKWCAAEEAMSGTARKVLQELRSGGPGIPRQLRARTGVNGSAMSKALDWLSENGMVVKGEYGWAAL